MHSRDVVYVWSRLHLFQRRVVLNSTTIPRVIGTGQNLVSCQSLLEPQRPWNSVVKVIFEKVLVQQARLTKKGVFSD